MARLAAALLAALALAGCGEETAEVPRGDPAVRHGEGPLRDYLAVEEIRAQLAGASDFYYSGGDARGARALVEAAKDRYSALAGRVRREDPLLDRELGVAFDRADRALARGVAPDSARDAIGPLGDQLLDGVMQALVPQDVRLDPGVQADAMSKLLERINVLRDAGLPQLYAQAWGNLRRAQALHVALAEDLGPEKERVTNAFADLRSTSFPAGARVPPGGEMKPPAQAIDRIRAALEERFGLITL